MVCGGTVATDLRVFLYILLGFVGKKDCPNGLDEDCPHGCGISEARPLLSTVGRIVGGIEVRFLACRRTILEAKFAFFSFSRMYKKR